MDKFSIEKTFIEESFPVKEVSEESVREKNIRHGHISTLHIWWARRPLAASRATVYAALVPSPSDDSEWEKTRQFIIQLSKWENSLNEAIIEKARKDILNANGKRLRVLDPFAGGGSIPLEALRLGCEVYAGEYNPVAVLILKAVLEYPQKYGRKVVKTPLGEKITNPLLEDVKKWGKWVLERAKREIGSFYPLEEDGSIPIGYIWARTIPCHNPSCNVEIPLMRQFWLAKKDKKKVALYPYVEDKEVKFKVVGDGYEPMPEFDPLKGTVKGAIATCLVCGFTVDANTVRRLHKEGKAGQRMVAVVLHNIKKKGKVYKIANEKDLEVFRQAEEGLQRKVEELREKWGIEPIPDEPTPEGKGRGAERAFSVRNYGLNTWGNLFNSRQKLALITFVDEIKEAYHRMINEGYDGEYAKAVVTYLGLTLSRLADKNATLVIYNVVGEKIEHVFSRQALPITWDYIELNTFSGANGDWLSNLEWVIRNLEHCSKIKYHNSITFHASATELSFPDNHFDAIFTDPPYYDNVPYSDLSDFFYVWLKRTVGDIYPDLFSTPLTPKSKEIVAHSLRHDGWREAKKFFEDMLKKSFQEIYRVLKPNGVVIIIYAHKSTAGWETLINSLLDSGLVITASWPVNTEIRTRLRAKESAALASSIYIVARKMEKQGTGWSNEVKEEIRKHIYKKLDRLWQEGISGADFLIAAIGSAIEIFGKYEKVMDYEGNIIRADRLLEHVREVVTDYTVRQILHNGIAEELSPLTRFYLLWRWTYGEAKAHFDDARKLAQSVGIDLSNEWKKGFIKKDKEFIKVLGPHERDLKDLNSNELIDLLHKVLLLWEKSKKEEIVEMLKDVGWFRDSFFRVAQAISECLSKDSKEKRLLDGFLTGKERIIKEAGVGQRRLNEY
jgi:adenine-specific DNA methylase